MLHDSRVRQLNAEAEQNFYEREEIREHRITYSMKMSAQRRSDGQGESSNIPPALSTATSTARPSPLSSSEPEENSFPSPGDVLVAAREPLINMLASDTSAKATDYQWMAKAIHRRMNRHTGRIIDRPDHIKIFWGTVRCLQIKEDESVGEPPNNDTGCDDRRPAPENLSPGERRVYMHVPNRVPQNTPIKKMQSRLRHVAHHIIRDVDTQADKLRSVVTAARSHLKELKELTETLVDLVVHLNTDHRGPHYYDADANDGCESRTEFGDLGDDDFEASLFDNDAILLPEPLDVSPNALLDCEDDRESSSASGNDDSSTSSDEDDPISNIRVPNDILDSQPERHVEDIHNLDSYLRDIGDYDPEADDVDAIDEYVDDISDLGSDVETADEIKNLPCNCFEYQVSGTD